MVTEKNPSTTRDNAREEMAKLLDGHELRGFDDVVAQYQESAAEIGLVIVFGASDDLMELRGAIDDEVDACGGGSAFISDGALLLNKCGEGDFCPYFRALQAKAFEVIAVWCGSAEPYVWAYRLGAEHATFTILEDGEPWCRGVVFALADIPSAGEEGMLAVTADEAADLALCLEEVASRFPGNLTAVLRQAFEIAANGSGRTYLEVEEG